MAKLLLIEDDAALRRTLSRVLTAAGHDVIEAADGRQGLRRFTEEQPDLVITDIVMPDQEGLETIRGMLALKPETPIIAMSGGGTDGGELYLTLASQLGAKETLQKPFRPEELHAVVTRVLEAAAKR